MRLLPLAALALAASWAPAHAEPVPAPAPAPAPAIATYAIVVGSNAGGPGQTDLRYAEDDARRVAAVLTELGGYPPEAVDVVVHPTPDQLRDRLAKLADRVRADAAAGRQARVFFYYSGHARAQGIDLGATELPLTELRERLFAIPAALTVVVLDACQSGAFSRIKGAQAAADFSFSSRQHLDATGVAVLASSSGSELSQESEQLKGSYFTHNLLVGLRGAGDANGDGQVSIDEAYRYAYHQTLLETAETAVGGQHVTFEADLKGHGEVPLSYPRAATAQIVLPASLEGKTLVEDRRAHAVAAEIYKAKGTAVRIAIAPGDYDVLVRDGHSLSRCPVTAPGELDLARCRREALVVETAKGGPGALQEPWQDPHRYMAVLDLLVGPEHHDGYTDNLAAFGYNEDLAPSGGFALTGLRQIYDRLWIGATAGWASIPSWKHDIVGTQNLAQQLDWSVAEVMATMRIEQGWWSWLAYFGQLSAGLGIGHSALEGADHMTYASTNFGPAFAAAIGLRVHFGHAGFAAGWQYDGAYAVKDLIGNTHAAGGNRLVLGFSWGF
ncbi:MAG: caspase family protein [Kofleriaceae bacterium]